MTQDDILSKFITFEFPLGPEVGEAEGSKLGIPLPTGAVWSVYNVLHSVGIDESTQLIYIAGVIAQLLIEFKLKYPSKAFPAIWQDLAQQLMDDGTRWTEGEERVLGFCYRLLQWRLITREDAAAIGRKFLGEGFVKNADTWPKKVDAWRKKMDRFIQRHKLDPIGQPKRRKRTNITGRLTS